MATKLYTIQDLLIGKNYRSHSRHDEGTILTAEKRDSVFYGVDYQAYLIEVRSTRGIKDFYATVAVKVGE